MDTSILEAPGRRRRRRHSAEFKAQLIQACQQPGVSSAAVALANGLNANMLRRWVNDSEQTSSGGAGTTPGLLRPLPAAEFVALQLPTSTPPADIRIELQRSGVSVSITWPVSAAAECATWMREVLR